MVSLECLQQPAAEQTLFVRAGEQCFRPSGPVALPQPLSPATAAQKQPQTTSVQEHGCVPIKVYLQKQVEGYFFLSRQWVFLFGLFI